MIGDVLAALATSAAFNLITMEVYSMTYKLMKRIIQNGLKKGNLDKENTMQKLDAFLAVDRITVEEYQELVELMGGAENE